MILNAILAFFVFVLILLYVAKSKQANRLKNELENYKKVWNAIDIPIFIKDKNDTLSNLVSAHNVDLLTQNKKLMQINYDEFKGILTYNIGNVSIIGNDFLKVNPDFDFFMDITSRRTISLRANGNIDVSKMAARIGNGGGHPNASGGLLNSFKDSFVYDNIKRQVEDIILSKGINKENQNGK